MLYLSIRLYFAPVLVIDDEVTDEQGQRLGVWAALRRSWQMTSGHMLSLLVYGFLATLIIFSTLFLFCVGIFFVGLPLAMTFYGAAYETLRRSP
jgi:membrane-anchored glycerophosphoryl diester phosphodiesterase (GDPDase)